MNGYNAMGKVETRQYLINFYRTQFLVFTDIGIGGLTKFGVEITEKLIDCTANRLDQIIKGEKTFKNMCPADRIMSILGRHLGDVPEGEPALINSNRSFIGNTASKFDIRDLSRKNEMAVVSQTDYIYVSEKHRHSIEHTVYIDNIFTAYNSETMQAILSHDN